ncbi:thioredoxin family protein [Alkalicoccobacillus gibsonii]|uniref:Thioredoxin family protein n=1 Tax=Alkalicoccobacillus gibsonii TaxID=79881 RepID=A0ABU9VHY6_9BACI
MIERSIDEITRRIESKEDVIVFIHTPLCGTCKYVSNMLQILEESYEQLTINQLNINQYPDFAQMWQIKSVPCLLVFQKGLGVKRQYSFPSIADVYTMLQPYLSIQTTNN